MVGLFLGLSNIFIGRKVVLMGYVVGAKSVIVLMPEGGVVTIGSMLGLLRERMRKGIGQKLAYGMLLGQGQIRIKFVKYSMPIG